MTDPQQNQLDSNQLTFDYLQQPANVAIRTPREGVSAVEGSLNIVHTLVQVQAGKTTGITSKKERLRESVTKPANSCRQGVHHLRQSHQ